MDRVRFDDIGRIRAFPPGIRLSSEEIATLHAARITPLTQTNAAVTGEAPRTERECLIRFIDMLSSNGADSTNCGAALMTEVRALWNSGTINGSSLRTLLKRGANELSSVSGVAEEIRALTTDTRQKKTLPQYYDNIYGRRYETLLVQGLIADPPDGAMAAARQIGHETSQYLAGLQRSERRTIELDLARLVRNDRRPWFGAAPEVGSWLATSAPEALASLLGRIDSGPDVIRVMYMIQKLLIAVQSSKRPMPWAATAQRHYDTVICPARSEARSNANHTSAGFGVGLHYHPAQLAPATFELASHFTYSRTPSFGDGTERPRPTGFERNALVRGQTLVSGASGTATLFGFMVDHMVAKGVPISRGDATLAGIMFMTFDTGHSTHEVLATTRSIEARSLADPAQLLSDYDRGYEGLARLPGNPHDREKVRAIMDRALDQTVAYFVTHVKHV